MADVSVPSLSTATPTSSDYVVGVTSGGAMRRFALSSLSPLIDVKNRYGATGDGTTDDTSAIQAAITANTYGTLYFPPGTYKITSPITIPTTSLAGQTRRDRHLLGYGAVIKCSGTSQANGFTFSAAGPWPATSYNLFVEGLTFDGAVTGAYINFANAENFFENLLFEKITTTNAATAATLFQFTNGSASNLGGVTIRRCSGGDNITNMIRFKGSASYGQFDNFTLEDLAHIGTGSMIVLDGSVASTTLQYSQLRRLFSAGYGTRGISGANQFMTNCVISNFYAEPKGSDYTSIECELIECQVEDVVNTVADFTAKTIRVHSSGGTRDTQFINCRSYTGTVAPWESAAYTDISITYPTNVSIKGVMERYFTNAVSYSKPHVYPASAQSTRVCNVDNARTIASAAVPATKVLYTFTNSAGGNTYDASDDVFEINLAGELYGGVTNFAAEIQMYDGTNTEVLASLSVAALNANSRTFRVSSLVRITSTLMQTLHSEGVFNNGVVTHTPSEVNMTGVFVRANSPVLRIVVSTLDTASVAVKFVEILRKRRVSDYTWT